MYYVPNMGRLIENIVIPSLLDFYLLGNVWLLLIVSLMLEYKLPEKFDLSRWYSITKSTGEQSFCKGAEVIY